ncbi:MAG: hypothetical protein RR825_01715 [Ruthenibacterium sp.]
MNKTAKRPADEPVQPEKAYDGFENSVLEAAGEQAQRIIEQAQRDSRAAYEAQMGQEKGDPAAAHKTDTEAALRRRIAGARQSNLQKLLIYRKQLVTGLFAECEEQLDEFTKTPAYAAFVADTLAPYVERAKDGCTVYLRIGDDAPKAALQKLLPKVQFANDPSIRIGGAKLQCGRILYDETLGQRMRDERTAFLQRCKLRVDTVGMEQDNAAE